MFYFYITGFHFSTLNFNYHFHANVVEKTNHNSLIFCVIYTLLSLFDSLCTLNHNDNISQVIVIKYHIQVTGCSL